MYLYICICILHNYVQQNFLALQVDNERHRISLGMKNSHFGDDIEIQTPSKLTSDEDEGDKEEGEGEEVVDRNGQMDNTHKPNSDHQSQVEEFPVLAQVESRASILPLEVSLDDIEQADMDVAVSWTEEHAAVADTKDEKSKRRAKRKQKEDRSPFSFLLHLLIVLYFSSKIKARQ